MGRAREVGGSRPADAQGSDLPLRSAESRPIAFRRVTRSTPLTARRSSIAVSAAASSVALRDFLSASCEPDSPPSSPPPAAPPPPAMFPPLTSAPIDGGGVGRGCTGTTRTSNSSAYATWPSAST